MALVSSSLFSPLSQETQTLNHFFLGLRHLACLFFVSWVRKHCLLEPGRIGGCHLIPQAANADSHMKRGLYSQKFLDTPGYNETKQFYFYTVGLLRSFNPLMTFAHHQEGDIATTFFPVFFASLFSSDRAFLGLVSG